MEGGVSGFPGMMVLNSHNNAGWKIKMEYLLIVKYLYEPVDREQIPTGVLESEWKLLNRKAMATIRQFIECQSPLACGKWHKCPQDVEETVKAVREVECPQQDIFDEKEKYRDGETNFNT